MSYRLSSFGIRLKELSDAAARNVAFSIREMVGDKKSGQTVKIGADGTPTKSIDTAAENAIFKILRNSGMGFKVLSEEMGEISIGDDPDIFLYLDPLDGTFNAINGIPFYSVSFFYVQGMNSFGYIHDLSSGCSYFAESGRGAYNDSGLQLSVSKTENLKNFSVSAYTQRPHTGRINGIGDNVRRIRTLGSNSLEMALMASGKLDAFIDLRGMLRVVDAAAGKLIIEESGGIITDSNGCSLSLDGNMWQRRDLIGSNGLLHNDLLKLCDGGSN